MTISRNPGWHRLANGVAVYSDATADKFLNPEGMLNDDAPNREQQGAGQRGIQVLGTFVGPTESQRTLTSLSPSKFEDFYEEGREVPLAPFPKVKDAWHQIEWDDEDWYEVEPPTSGRWKWRNLNTTRETLQKKWPSMTKSAR